MAKKEDGAALAPEDTEAAATAEAERAAAEAAAAAEAERAAAEAAAAAEAERAAAEAAAADKPARDLLADFLADRPAEAVQLPYSFNIRDRWHGQSVEVADGSYSDGLYEIVIAGGVPLEVRALAPLD